MKGLRCRKGNYYGEFYDPAKNPTRREYPLRTRDKREAEQIYVQLRREYALGTFDPWKDKRPGRISLTEAVDAFLRTRSDETRYSAETYRGYVNTLTAFDESTTATSADRITERRVERFIRSGDWAASTQNQYLQRLETFCNWLIEKGYLDENPATATRKRLNRESPKRRVAAGRRRDFFMPKELSRVLSAIYTDSPEEGSRQMSRDHVAAMAELAVCTGLSVSEVSALRHDDVRLRHVQSGTKEQPLAGQLILPRVKTGQERVIPLVPRAALLLHTWMDRATHEGTQAVFFGPRDRNAVAPTRASYLFRQYLNEAELSGRLTFHSTRHSFVSWLLMLGLPVYVVKELAGHTDSKMTERYAHVVRRYLMGRARDVAADILSFYCPGIERGRLLSVVGHTAGTGLGGYAFGGSMLLDVLFGGSLYKEKRTDLDMSTHM